jgi:hypothetical protein
MEIVLSTIILVIHRLLAKKVIKIEIGTMKINLTTTTSRVLVRDLTLPILKNLNYISLRKFIKLIELLLYRRTRPRLLIKRKANPITILLNRILYILNINAYIIVYIVNNVIVIAYLNTRSPVSLIN